MKIINLGYLRLLRIIFIILIISFTSACSSIANKAVITAKSEHSIQGYLVQSDGVTPIAGATISVATPHKVQIAIAPSDGNCAEPSVDFHTYTCTMEDGSFSLLLNDIKNIPLTLSVELNNQRQEISIGSKSKAVDMGTLSFAPNVESKEKVAIVLDFYNPFEDIRELLEEDSTDIQAAKHQLINEYQNIYNISNETSDISFPTFYSLFIDEDMDGKADIHNYETLYINSRSQGDIALLEQSLKNELAEFIANGGNLYITEWRIELEVVEPGPDQFI